jgi:hypothetical protein
MKCYGRQKWTAAIIGEGLRRRCSVAPQTPALLSGHCLLSGRCLGSGRRPRRHMQVVPFTVKAVGEALLLDQVPWKPNVVDPPAGTLPL